MTDSRMIAPHNARPIPPTVRLYLENVVRACADGGLELVSVVLFGSAATGGFSETVSDVDMILVVPDETGREDRNRLRDVVEGLEALHGFRKNPARPRGPLEAFVEKVTANVRSFFICTRSDMLSGRVARILDLKPAQALFVDREVIPSIVTSAVTVSGEDLLTQIPMPPIRRFDVLKAFHGFLSQALLSMTVFPVLPNATKYAMGTLKRSLHNCYFCYHGRRASLEEEVNFFQQRLGANRTIAQLLTLRGDYRRSFAFVAGCLPTLMRLHWRTAFDNRFPRAIQNP
ncbi:MAG: nucleotidyltransferase domain-containing protein [Acidobacteriota bacterium]|nr:nucleotidyltransferase domain-containing protein [Acidobacteriota bacterium]